MTIDFQDYFWGEKQNGFDILYQNLKCGSTSGKELVEFIRARTIVEEYNFNLLIKLSRKTNNNQQLGTFQPLWHMLKSSTEKLSSLHMQTVQRLNQLIKDINKYCDDHHKKQKQIKNEEITTIDTINELKETIASLNKAKEFYFAKAVEVDRLRRENASQKDIEKAEARVSKACTEYKNLIEKYTRNKDDFEKKFCSSCQNFQKLEDEHIRHMKDYLYNYSQILQTGHTLIGQVYKEFQNNCNELTTEKLLETFVKAKGTGNHRPAVIKFEEANLNSFQLSLPTNNATTTANTSTVLRPSKTTSTTNTNTAASDLINLDSMFQSSVPSSTLSNAMGGDHVSASINDNVNMSNTLTSNPVGPKKEAISATTIAAKSTTLDQNNLLSDDPHSLSATTSATTNQKDHHKSFPDIRVNSRASKWFLKSKKDKSKDKKNKSKKDSDDDGSNNGSISGSKIDLDDPSSSVGNDYFIDAEGFTVRSQPVKKEDDNFYSSSGSDSDSDDEKEKKIYVKINPLKNGSHISSSVDQLIASAGALTLAPSCQTSRRANLSANPSPVLNEGLIKRSTSATHTAFKSNDENDLFSIFAGESGSKSNSNNNSSKLNSIGSNDSTPTSAVADPFSNPVKNPISNSTESASNGNLTLSRRPSSSFSTSTIPKANDRYAALSDLFSVTPSDQTNSSAEASKITSTSESNILPLPPKTSTESSSFNALSMTNNSLSKSFSSTSIMGTNSFSIYKPLSKSFASSYSQSMSSNGMMSRADSVSSLSSDFRMTPISICSSRDSSPLTIGMSDVVPIAIAFQESIGACFKGADENLCKINVIGCIKMAFSSGIIQVFSTNPYLAQLTFRLKNINRLDKIILSKELVTQIDSNDESTTYEMNMSTLQSSLKRLYEQTPNARYYNLDIFKYQLRTLPGARNAPLQLVSYWKCEQNSTNLKIDFKYNSSAFTNCPPQLLKNVQFTANIDGNVLAMNSQPEGKWDSLTKQASWRFNEISHLTGNSGLSSIKGKFDLSDGPSCPSSVYVQFSSQETTLSGLEFELIGSGYRLSLIKRQFSSGRYYCEPKF